MDVGRTAHGGIGLLADYPMWEPEGKIERFMEIDLTDEERRDRLYNNAAALFGIKNYFLTGSNMVKRG